MAAVLVCMGALAQEIGSDPGIRCSWVDDGGGSGHYECSGYGSAIYVYGGGGVTVTNAFGTCTNCVNVTPEKCLFIKSFVSSMYWGISNNVEQCRNLCLGVESNITSQLDDISTFRRFGDAPNGNSSVSERRAFTNYIYSVDNSQTALDLQVPSQYHYGQSIVSYNNGIYDFATQVTKPALESYASSIRQIRAVSLFDIEDQARAIHSAVDSNLDCTSCSGSEGEDYGGGGSTNNCNTCSGAWCTEEQGDAIISLLEDMKDYTQRIGSLVLSISNSVEGVIQNLREGLFTSYTHIPAETDLGMTWQELYLSGYSPNFHGYANTNILARIELLLAGMSGVLTNSNEISTSLNDEFQSSADEVESSLTGFSADVAEAVATREQNVRSVGDAIIGLYSAFRGWSGTPFSRETLINSYSVEIGNDHWDVPSFEPSENGLRVANLLRVVCRSVMSVVYILFTVAIFVRFHIAFFQWVLKYLKWAIELMQGLFA